MYTRLQSDNVIPRSGGTESISRTWNSVSYRRHHIISKQIVDRSKIDDGRRQRGIGIGVGVFLQLLGATSRSQLGDPV